MVDDDYNLTLIDFPQMVSTNHSDAIEYFNRDVKCVRLFFERKHNYISEMYPKLENDTEVHTHLDEMVEASGFSKKEAKDLEDFLQFLKDNDIQYNDSMQQKYHKYDKQNQNDNNDNDNSQSQTDEDDDDDEQNSNNDDNNDNQIKHNNENENDNNVIESQNVENSYYNIIFFCICLAFFWRFLICQNCPPKKDFSKKN